MTLEGFMRADTDHRSWKLYARTLMIYSRTIICKAANKKLIVAQSVRTVIVQKCAAPQWQLVRLSARRHSKEYREMRSEGSCRLTLSILSLISRLQPTFLCRCERFENPSPEFVWRGMSGFQWYFDCLINCVDHCNSIVKTEFFHT